MNLKTFIFEANSISDSKMMWNYQGYGTCTVSKIKENKILLENVLNIPKIGVSTDSQIWQKTKDELHFYHCLQGEYFLIFTFKEKQQQPYSKYTILKPYLCTTDTYTSSLEYSKDTINISTKIIGKNKNEIIKYTYTT